MRFLSDEPVQVENLSGYGYGRVWATAKIHNPVDVLGGPMTRGEVGFVADASKAPRIGDTLYITVTDEVQA